MTPALFKACLSALGWSHDDLASYVGCDRDVVQGWGERSRVPPEIDEWLQGLAGMVTGSNSIEHWVAWRNALPFTYPPPEDAWPVEAALPELGTQRSTA